MNVNLVVPTVISTSGLRTLRHGKGPGKSVFYIFLHFSISFQIYFTYHSKLMRKKQIDTSDDGGDCLSSFTEERAFFYARGLVQ